MHLQARAFVGRGRTLKIDGKAFRQNTCVDRLAVLARSRAYAGAIQDLERQLGNSKVMARSYPIRFQPKEELPDILERADRGKVVGSDVRLVRAGVGEIDLLDVSRLRVSRSSRIIIPNESWANQHLHVL